MSAPVYEPGSAGTAGRGYLVPTPRDTPAIECADPDEYGARRPVHVRERVRAEEGR